MTLTSDFSSIVDTVLSAARFFFLIFCISNIYTLVCSLVSQVLLSAFLKTSVTLQTRTRGRALRCSCTINHRLWSYGRFYSINIPKYPRLDCWFSVGKTPLEFFESVKNSIIHRFNLFCDSLRFKKSICVLPDIVDYSDSFHLKSRISSVRKQFPMSQEWWAELKRETHIRAQPLNRLPC